MEVKAGVCGMQAVQLTDLWSAALAQGAVGKAAALDSARSVLNFGLSLTPDTGLDGTSSVLYSLLYRQLKLPLAQPPPPYLSASVHMCM